MLTRLPANSPTHAGSRIVVQPLLCASHDFGWNSRTRPFLNHWGNTEAYLNQRCVKKNVPESSQPISLSRPLTLWLEDERSNLPSDKSDGQPLETGSTQPGLSDIEAQLANVPLCKPVR